MNKGSHAYCLIQQATIPPVKDWKKEKGILGNLDLEYMGSAEFEYGAIPAAMLSFIEDPNPKTYGKITVNLPVDKLGRTDETKEVVVRYLVRKDQEEGLQHLLSNWKKASNGFKEWNVSLLNQGDFCICIDRGYFCFMWNGKLGKRIIEEHFHTSCEMMGHPVPLSTPVATILKLDSEATA